jgi:hypothetical protein
LVPFSDLIFHSTVEVDLDVLPLLLLFLLILLPVTFGQRTGHAMEFLVPMEESGRKGIGGRRGSR